MLNCKQASQLMSRAMDNELPFWKRISLKMHLMVCDGCNNFSSQTRLLRMAARAFGTSRHGDKIRLSDEARQRIYKALQDAQLQKERQEKI